MTVEIGTTLPPHEYTVRRLDAVRYCGAGTDYAGIHWNERIARSVELDDVVAHGAMTVARALRAIHDWTGDPAALVSYRTRFRRPVYAPDDQAGFRVRVTGTVTELLDAGQVAIELVATGDDGGELSTTRAVVRLA
jgi:acyl dehydratase